MQSSLELLRKLKESYDKGLVSALIGAGFTKNAYGKAVGWWELLRGIVDFTYETELKNRYQQYLHILASRSDAKSYKDCLEGYEDEIIKRDGYLKVVSNFIKAKGCREAIDVYIEEKNPYFISTDKGTMVSGDDATIITDNDLATHKAFLECTWQHIFTTNYDNALEYTSNHYHLNHEVIKCDYEMSSNKLHNSIIKIHGDLVNSEVSLDAPFQFDNDKTRRYIISEDDYETYPTKHQAFSYLMRIAMLSGTYCLIGFSGDDPNFISWLEWVKDILDKEVGNNNNDVKVFLISIDEKDIPKEKELFYSNHHIGVINLNDVELQKELNINTTTPSIANLFQSLFAYLDINSLKQSDPGEDKPYNSHWQKVYEKLNSRKGESFADDLIRIQKSQDIQLFNQDFFFQEPVYDFICRSKTPLNEEQKTAILLALNDLNKPLCLIPTKIQEQLATEVRWKEYVEWQKTLQAATDTIAGNTDVAVYQIILRRLYNFDFTTAKRLLCEWSPSGIWLCRKASINYLFDKDDSIQSLKKVESSSNDRQIRYFANTIRRYIEIQLKVDNCYQGLEGIQECIFYHINQLRQPKLEFQRYGQSGNLVSYNEMIEKKEQKSLSFFRLIASYGLNPTYSILNVIKVQDWYLAFHCLFLYYPWACLYYSSHYNDKDVLTRIGQDYAYSIELKPELPKLLNRALEVLTNGDLPFFMQFGMLQICSRFFVAVDEIDFFDAIKTYLLRVYFKEKGDKVYSNYAQTFVCLALNSLKSEDKISEVFSLLLDYYKSNEKDAIEIIVNHLRFSKLSKLTKKQTKLIEEILCSCNVNYTVYLAARLDYEKLLPQTVKKEFLARILRESSILSAIKMRPLACLCNLAKKDASDVTKLKEEVLRRDYWGPSVIMSYGGEEEFFRFSLLPPKEYIFGIQEIFTIAQKLDVVFNSLVASNSMNRTLFGMFLENLLDEMECFVDLNKSVFSDSFLEEFQTCLNKQRGFASLQQAFYSDETEHIVKGIKLLNKRLGKLKFSDIKEFYEIALNRVMIKQKTANTRLLDFVANITNSKRFKKAIVSDKIIIAKLLLLLQLYRHADLSDYNFEVVDATLSFRLIAKVLREAGRSDSYVDWWLDDEQNNRFNFIDID